MMSSAPGKISQCDFLQGLGRFISSTLLKPHICACSGFTLCGQALMSLWQSLQLGPRTIRNVDVVMRFDLCLLTYKREPYVHSCGKMT